MRLVLVSLELDRKDRCIPLVETVVHPNHGLLLSNKKNRLAICKSWSQPPGNFAKGKVHAKLTTHSIFFYLYNILEKTKVENGL